MGFPSHLYNGLSSLTMVALLTAQLCLAQKSGSRAMQSPSSRGQELLRLSFAQRAAMQHGTVHYDFERHHGAISMYRTVATRFLGDRFRFDISGETVTLPDGKEQEIVTTVSVDGDVCRTYGTMQGAAIRSRETVGRILFHPRSLGTDPYINPGRTLEAAFRLHDGFTYAVDEARSQDGVIAVKASSQANQSQYTYFIDTNRDHALAAVEGTFAGGHTASIVNELALWPGGVWFPVVSEMTARNAGEDELTTTFTVWSADFTDAPHETAFHFEGMNVEPGTPIDDWFQMRVTHVWDGSTKVPYDDYIDSIRGASTTKRVEPTKAVPAPRQRTFASVVVLAVLPLLALALVVRFLQKRGRCA